MARITRCVFNREFLILNGAMISFLLIVVFFPPIRPVDEILLFTSDSITYMSSGNEFFDLHRQGDSWTRPFLYSYFLKQVYNIGGARLIVLFQSLFWLASGNLIFYGIKNISKKPVTRIMAVSAFVINLSLISYIFHGLTELMTVFFLSCITYLTAKSLKKGFDIKYTLSVILLLSLLTVTKPLFLYPLFLFLAAGFIFHIKSFTANPKFILFLVISIAPLIIQYSAMYSKYGVFKISAIGELTFDKYLLSQGIRKIEHIQDIDESQNMALNMSKKEKVSYVLKHKRTYLSLYSGNIKDNITGYGTSIILPAGYHVKGYVNFMSGYNQVHYYAFLIFLPVFLTFSAIDLFTKPFSNWQQLLLGIVLYYIILTSGISFWQADRLVIFSIPLWITLYTLLIIRIRNTNFAGNLFSKKKKQDKK